MEQAQKYLAEGYRWVVDLGLERFFDPVNHGKLMGQLVFLSEFEDWRLVVSSRQFDTADPRYAYRLVHDSLSRAEVGSKKTPAILISPTRDPFVRELRRKFGKVRASTG